MSKSKAPTGLSIARSGSKFTFSWKKGDSDYENGQHLWYRINNGGWVKPAIGKTAISFSVTSASVKTITFQVQGNRKKYKKSGKTVYRKKRENERIRFREYAPDADFAA